MQLTMLLLNDWLQTWAHTTMNLAGSTGSTWSFDDLLRLDGFGEVGCSQLGYAPLEGAQELRLAIAGMHNVDPDWVVVTNGATEAFHVIISALGRRGNHVLVPSPGYPAMCAIAEVHGLSVRSYSLTRENRFNVVQQKILSLAASRATAFVLINTPHNPSGAVVDPSMTHCLAERLGERAIPLVVDEVFHPIYHGCGGATVGGGSNVISVGDLSKAFSLPGLRVGWIIDSDLERRDLYRRTRGIMSLGGSPLLESLAVSALRSRQEIVARTAATASRNLARLRYFMDEIGDVLDWVPPDGGLVAFPWFRDGRDARPFCERLATKGVLLVPGDCFGMRDCVRIGIGCQPATFDAALVVIRQELRRS